MKAIAVVRQTRQSERLSLPGAANPAQDGNRGGISCPQDLWHFFLFVEFLSNSFSTLTKRRLLVWFQDLVAVTFSPDKTNLCFISRSLPILSNIEGLGDGWGAVRATSGIITDRKIPGNCTKFIIKSPRKCLCGATRRKAGNKNKAA